MPYAAFKDSAVTRMDEQHLLEESTALPTTLFPVFIGNGTIGMNLDASGLQSLDTQRLNAWWGAGNDGNYLFRHGLLSSHLAWKDERYPFHFNLMPTGFLDWTLTYGATTVDSANLKDRAHVWTRKVDLAGSSVETSMLFGADLRLTITIFIPFGGTKIITTFSVKAYDQRNQPIPAKPFALTVRMRLRLRLRDGGPIFDDVAYDHGDARVRHAGYAAYAMRYRWQHDRPVTPITAADTYGFTWNDETGNAAAELHACLDVDAPEPVEPFTFTTVRACHEQAWKEFWADAGMVRTGDLRRDFLFANSVHLLRCCHEYSKGGLGNGLAAHAECWMGCNFWDMHWLCDGLLRANQPDLVRQFILWLRSVMRPTGRPFPWMMTYDGRTPVKPEEDHGLVVIDAFAMIAIRCYHDSRDETLFRDCVWPILDAVCGYLVADIFSREGDHYIIGKPLGHDVGGMAEALVNDTYTNVWSTSILRRSLMLARDHGIAPAWAPTAETIIATIHIEGDATHFHQARAVKAEDFSFASWVPNLLYPTEMQPFLDREKVRATREDHPFNDLYMEKQGDYQPWSYFWTALCDLRRGAVDSAEQVIQDGMQFTHAAGYFCECGPWQWGSCGLAPYPTPHGAFLTAVSEQLFSGSYWDDSLQLCTGLPTSLKHRTIQAANLRSGNGSLLQELTYCPDAITAVISGQRRRSVVCLLPPGVSTAKQRAVQVDGTIIAADFDDRAHTVTFDLDLSGPARRVVIAAC
jgi:hypothetical protein